jgi:Tfp pilus assembly protein FimT
LRHSTRSLARGFTMFELLIGATIVAAVLGAVASIVVMMVRLESTGHTKYFHVQPA